MRLFGGKARPGETLKSAMARKLKATITCPGTSNQQGSNVQNEPRVGDLLSVWHRINFEGESTGLLPYLPPHVTRPKERIEVYQVLLPPKCVFEMRGGAKHLDVVPLSDLLMLCDDPILNSVPNLLGRFNVIRMQREGGGG